MTAVILKTTEAWIHSHRVSGPDSGDEFWDDTSRNGLIIPWVTQWKDLKNAAIQELIYNIYSYK